MQGVYKLPNQLRSVDTTEAINQLEALGYPPIRYLDAIVNNNSIRSSIVFSDPSGDKIVAPMAFHDTVEDARKSTGIALLAMYSAKTGVEVPVMSSHALPIGFDYAGVLKAVCEKYNIVYSIAEQDKEEFKLAIVKVPGKTCYAKSEGNYDGLKTACLNVLNFLQRSGELYEIAMKPEWFTAMEAGFARVYKWFFEYRITEPVVAGVISDGEANKVSSKAGGVISVSSPLQHVMVIHAFVDGEQVGTGAGIGEVLLSVDKMKLACHEGKILVITTVIRGVAFTWKGKIVGEKIEVIATTISPVPIINLAISKGDRFLDTPNNYGWETLCKVEKAYTLRCSVRFSDAFIDMFGMSVSAHDPGNQLVASTFLYNWLRTCAHFGGLELLVPSKEVEVFLNAFGKDWWAGVRQFTDDGGVITGPLSVMEHASAKSVALARSTSTVTFSMFIDGNISTFLWSRGVSFNYLDGSVVNFDGVVDILDTPGRVIEDLAAGTRGLGDIRTLRHIGYLHDRYSMESTVIKDKRDAEVIVHPHVIGDLARIIPDNKRVVLSHVVDGVLVINRLSSNRGYQLRLLKKNPVARPAIVPSNDLFETMIIDEKRVASRKRVRDSYNTVVRNSVLFIAEPKDVTVRMEIEKKTKRPKAVANVGSTKERLAKKLKKMK